jgi:hypothetical protein
MDVTITATTVTPAGHHLSASVTVAVVVPDLYSDIYQERF